jgi:GT2 family glycosyltransferase
VGLLCEDYFLYFEEIDWAVRGRGRLRLGYAPGSIGYHKEGATIGRPGRSASADIMALRNRLRFTRKRYPWALPVVWLGFLGVVVNRIRRGQSDRIAAILSIMFGLGRRVDQVGSPSRMKQA